MKQSLLIDAVPGEVRTALKEDGEVVEINIDRDAHQSRLGNIYLGRVVTVEPALGAAFVDLPAGAPGFLSVNEAAALIPPETESVPPIEKLLHEGQSVLVQVSKDATETKGPKLTTVISLPGRWLAFRPFTRGIAVSRRIGDEAERKRLSDIGKTALAGLKTEAGAIIRTLGEGADKEALMGELTALAAHWAELAQQVERLSAPALVWEELGPVEQALRDWARPDIDEILADDPALFAQAKTYLSAQMPELADRLAMNSPPGRLFEIEGVDEAIEDCLQIRLDLPGGGWITIEQTEALTAIDVNSGDNMQAGNREATALATNERAMGLIARELRRRDLGGMIVIDAIHQDLPKNREKVLSALKKALARDRAPMQILGWSAMELIEMTRKRTRKSLPRFLARHQETRPRLVKNAESTGYEICRRLRLVSRENPTGDLVVRAAPDVIDWFLAGKDRTLEGWLHRRILWEESDDGAADAFDVFARR